MITPANERISEVSPTLSVIATNVRKLSTGTLPTGLSLDEALKEVARQLDDCADVLENGW